MSQIFQKNIPKTILFDFLQKYCDTNKNQYIFSKESFKRAKIDNAIELFCENLI